MKKTIQRLRPVTIFAIALCTAMVVTATTPLRIAWAGDTVVYRLKWLFNVSTAGDLYADVNGLFTAAGLEVTVKPGGPERDAIKELELGYAQFGVASADQVIRARAKGARVVVVAQLFQINPLQWIYRPDRGELKTLNDLKGRKIGITYGGNDETIMRTLMAKAGLKESDVQLSSVRYDYTPFYRRKVEIWPVYRNAQGPILAAKLKAAGEDVAFFNPADFGVHFVANSVVTSERMMKTRPETVKQFVTALLTGWRQSLDPANQERTIRTLEQFDKDTSREILLEQLAITRQLIKPTASTVIGTVDSAAWRQTEKIMLDQKQIDAPVEVEKVLMPIGM